MKCSSSQNLCYWKSRKMLLDKTDNKVKLVDRTPPLFMTLDLVWSCVENDFAPFWWISLLSSYTGRLKHPVMGKLECAFSTRNSTAR